MRIFIFIAVETHIELCIKVFQYADVTVHEDDITFFSVVAVKRVTIIISHAYHSARSFSTGSECQRMHLVGGIFLEQDVLPVGDRIGVWILRMKCGIVVDGFLGIHLIPSPVGIVIVFYLVGHFHESLVADILG